jgi:hypothetical protein
MTSRLLTSNKHLRGLLRAALELLLVLSKTPAAALGFTNGSIRFSSCGVNTEAASYLCKLASYLWMNRGQMEIIYMADFAGDRVDETEELKACSCAFFICVFLSDWR